MNDLLVGRASRLGELHWEATSREQNQDPSKGCSPLTGQAALPTSAQPSFKIHMDKQLLCVPQSSPFQLGDLFQLYYSHSPNMSDV